MNTFFTSVCKLNCFRTGHGPLTHDESQQFPFPNRGAWNDSCNDPNVQRRTRRSETGCRSAQINHYRHSSWRVTITKSGCCVRMMTDATDRIWSLLSVPRLAVLSSAVSRWRSASFTFGQSSKSCQVRAGSRQVGTTALLLLAAALGASPAHSVWSDQHAVTRVTVEVVLATHRTVILSWRKTEKGLFEIPAPQLPSCNPVLRG